MLVRFGSSAVQPCSTDIARPFVPLGRRRNLYLDVGELATNPNRALPDSTMAEEPKDPPPAYEAAAIEHGALPAKSGPSAKPLPRGPFPLDIPVLNQLRGKRVILASASPRRKQILSTVPSPFPGPRHAHLTALDWTPRTRNPPFHQARKLIQRTTRAL